MRTARQKFFSGLNIAGLAFFAVMTLLPFAVMLINSFKSPNQMLGSVLFPSFPLQAMNYADAWNRMSPYIWNSVKITVVSAVAVTMIAGVSGFAFGRYSFPLKRVLFTLVILNMMIPSVLTLVPSYLITLKLGIYDTHLALLLPYMAGGSVMGIYLVRGFVEQLPGSLFEAARIDGVNEFQCFIKLALPMLTSVMTTVSILTVLSCWNDIVWPTIVLDSDGVLTIPLGLLEFNQQQGANTGALFAGYVIASAPLLVYFLLNQKSFMVSMTEGAIKQ